MCIRDSCEWARGHVATGFPWNAPGYLFSANLPLLQSASLVGLYGLTLLALAAGLAPAFWIAGQRKPAICLAALLPVLAAYGWGAPCRNPDAVFNPLQGGSSGAACCAAT